MAKKNLKDSLGALLDKAYSSGPLADAAAQMSGLQVTPSAALEEPVALNVSAPKIEAAAHQPVVVAPIESVDNGVIASIHPTIQSSEPVIHPTIQPAIQLSIQSASHPSSHPLQHPTIQPSQHPSSHPSTERIMYQPLTPGQGKVLLFLVEKCAGATNVEAVSGATQIPVGTVKDALRALLKYGYMVGKWRIVRHDFHGFGYSLNHQMCTEYVAKVNGLPHPSVHPLNQPSAHPSIQPTIHPFIQPSIPLSSSSNSIKTTTKTLSVDNMEHPELDWWCERGLTADQVAGWAAEFSIPSEQILQALKHAAFDIPVQEAKRGEKIDPFNWFYAGLKRFGTYRRPVGYRPLEQILLEEAKAQREEREKLARELAEERERGEVAAQELKFQQVLSDPTGAEYQRVKALVSTPGGLPLSGKMLEAAMREAFLGPKG